MQAKGGLLYAGAPCFAGHVRQFCTRSGGEDHRQFFALYRSFLVNLPVVRNAGEQLKVVMEPEHGFQLPGTFSLFRELRQFLTVFLSKQYADRFRRLC